MQKRDQSKFTGSAGGTSAPPAKRGRPFGSTNSNSSAGGSGGDAAAPLNMLGPSLQVHNTFADQNHKRIVLALQSGLKSELTWALNTLTLLSFKEKEDMRKDHSLAKVPGLLDALLQVIDDWRDIGLPKEISRSTRVRNLGANSLVTGFGHEYEALGSLTAPSHPGSVSTASEALAMKNAAKGRSSEWWSDEDEDEELVTNALETAVNLAPVLNLRNLSSQKSPFINTPEKRAVQAIMGILGSSVKTWQCAAAELIGRLIINPDNEPFLLPFLPQA
ncbi:unnamed protein product [Linum tenue]|uniref:Uncharacterized protein n=1 Tax=Linum tenue TaxID=586396 RepID=A0AAV0RS18_9ROSI|nr:unnamed protein product [Linum tenue]